MQKNVTYLCSFRSLKCAQMMVLVEAYNEFLGVLVCENELTTLSKICPEWIFYARRCLQPDIVQSKLLKLFDSLLIRCCLKKWSADQDRTLCFLRAFLKQNFKNFSPMYEAVEKALSCLQNNPEAKSLRLHPLTGLPKPTVWKMMFLQQILLQVTFDSTAHG